MERRTSAYLAQSVYALYGVAPNIRLRSLGKPEVAGLNPAVPTTIIRLFRLLFVIKFLRGSFEIYPKSRFFR